MYDGPLCNSLIAMCMMIQTDRLVNEFEGRGTVCKRELLSYLFRCPSRLDVNGDMDGASVRSSGAPLRLWVVIKSSC